MAETHEIPTRGVPTMAQLLGIGEDAAAAYPREMPDYEAEFKKLIAIDVSVAYFYRSWQHGLFESREAMLVALCVALANLKNEYSDRLLKHVQEMPSPFIVPAELLGDASGSNYAAAKEANDYFHGAHRRPE